MSEQKALDIILRSLAPYRIDENRIAVSHTILGRGAFGIVVLGEMGNTLVAVKQLHATGTLAENKKMALALAQELHVWAGLAHPHVVPLVGFSLDERMDKAWFLSPYMKNGNIRHYLNEHNPDMIVRLRMWGQTARGIAYLHRRNLCHGDVKGANVLVDDGGHAKLCDFGLTKLMESGTHGSTTSTGQKGTIRYMAPEFFHDERPARTRESDVWAWSCLGLEVLFDRLPYADVKMDGAIVLRIMRGDPPLDIDSIRLDEDIKQLFKRCWVAEPQERVDIKTCAGVVRSALQKLHPADDLDEPLSPLDHIAVPNPMEEANAVSIHAAHMNKKDTNGTSSGHSYSVMERSGIETASVSLETSSDGDELCRDIERWRRNLLSRPEGHPERHDSIDGLGVSLLLKYRKQGDVAALQEAITLLGQALLLRPMDHPERHESLYGLGVALIDNYREQGDVEVLHQAVDAFRQALRLLPVGHPERATTLYAFGASLMDKYVKEGDVGDLNEALDVLHQALLLRPVGHPERSISLYSCGRALRSKFYRDRDNADLLEAIALHQQALSLLKVDDRLRPLVEAALNETVVEQSGMATG